MSGCSSGHVTDFFFNFCLFIHLVWLCWVFVVACGLSLVLVTVGYFLVAAFRLIIVVASLVQHRL